MNIIEEINNTIEYKDDKLIIAKNYIADSNDYQRIIDCKDVLRVHKLVREKTLHYVKENKEDLPITDITKILKNQNM